VSARPLVLSFLASVCVVVACGARSSLDVPPPAPPPDAGPDAPFDTPPPVCDDAGVTFIYVVTGDNTLASYYPPDNTFTTIGTINCPVVTPGAAPYSMGVDRSGTAYVIFSDGNLYKVSTKDASCEATSFVVGQNGFVTFGLAFAADTNDPGETLFVAEEDSNGPSQGLATVDTQTLALSFIGKFSMELGPTELTGTGDGRLFGFSVDFPGPGSHVSQIDKATAHVLSSVALPIGGFNDGDTWAYWGGLFYIFDAPSDGDVTNVMIFDPTDQSLHMIGTYGQPIVGAGVSTCAPE
jgi:hypothetical protein